MEKTAICCHCKKELAYCGATTNLRDHLSRIHPSKYCEKKATTKIDSFVTKTTCSEGHAKKIISLLVEMIVLDLRPAAMVEGRGFRALMNYVEPNYRVPSAMHITSCLEEKYLQAKSILMQMLRDPSHITLTTDIWTSVAT